MESISRKVIEDRIKELEIKRENAKTKNHEFNLMNRINELEILLKKINRNKQKFKTT